MLSVIRKPRKCPRCCGNVYKLLFGEPYCSEQEYYEQYGKHVIFAGCCIISPYNPDYECEECELRFKIVSFPKNAKSLAVAALINGQEDGPFDGVKYCGIYRKQMVFEPTLKPGICYDGFVWVLVDQVGRVRILQGRKAFDFNPIIYKIRHRFDRYKENNRIAAKVL